MDMKARRRDGPGKELTMHLTRRCGVVLAAACLLGAGAAAAQERGGRPLAEILKDLGSAEFAVRERAQAELAKVPREQLEVLKEAQKQAKDAEVKARLQTRISEMELDALLHPPKLSVDLKDATLADVAAALNKQMGAAYIEDGPIPRGLPAPRVTLQAQDQSLWGILARLNEQVPMAFTARQATTFSLDPLAAAAPRRRILVTEFEPNAF
jgi:hypothetical protein